MKVNFYVPMLDLDDKPVLRKAGLQAVAETMLLAGIPRSAAEAALNNLAGLVDDKAAKTEEMTVGYFVSNALGSPHKDADWEERVMLTDLAFLIRRATEPVEITEADEKRIKTSVAAANEYPIYAKRVSEVLKRATAEAVAAEDKAAALAAAKKKA